MTTNSRIHCHQKSETAQTSSSVKKKGTVILRKVFVKSHHRSPNLFLTFPNVLQEVCSLPFKSSNQLVDQFISREHRAFPNMYCFNDSISWCFQNILHFHGFNDAHFFVFCYLLSNLHFQ